MPIHKPIKFETTLEPSLKKELLKFVKENKKVKTTLNATLGLIAFGGILTCAVMAPNALSVFAGNQKKKERERYQEYKQLWRNFHDLKKKKALEFVKEKNGYLVYRPTILGKKKIKKLILEEMEIKEPKKWDKKWRLVIFDIPESKKHARESMRYRLQQLDFFQCQKSVWIHPFPCIEEIEFLKDFFNIKPFVKLFIVDEMEDGKVLYHFKELIMDSL